MKFYMASKSFNPNIEYVHSTTERIALNSGENGLYAYDKIKEEYKNKLLSRVSKIKTNKEAEIDKTVQILNSITADGFLDIVKNFKNAILYFQRGFNPDYVLKGKNENEKLYEYSYKNRSIKKIDDNIKYIDAMKKFVEENKQILFNIRDDKVGIKNKDGTPNKDYINGANQILYYYDNYLSKISDLSNKRTVVVGSESFFNLLKSLNMHAFSIGFGFVAEVLLNEKINNSVKKFFEDQKFIESKVVGQEGGIPDIKLNFDTGLPQTISLKTWRDSFTNSGIYRDRANAYRPARYTVKNGYSFKLKDKRQIVTLANIIVTSSPIKIFKHNEQLSNNLTDYEKAYSIYETAALEHVLGYFDLSSLKTPDIIMINDYAYNYYDFVQDFYNQILNTEGWGKTFIEVNGDKRVRDMRFQYAYTRKIDFLDKSKDKSLSYDPNFKEKFINSGYSNFNKYIIKSVKEISLKHALLAPGSNYKK